MESRRSTSRTGMPVLALAAALLAGVPATPLAAQSDGEELFRATCAACHSTGADRVVGPGLAGVLERRERDWLLSFIATPDRVLSAGDPIATALLAEYLVPMPNLGVTPDQAAAILDYLAVAGQQGSVVRPVAASPPSPEQARLGQALFQGTTRLTNGGPGCNSCHEAVHAEVVGGGSLARDLTAAYSRLGPAGVAAILGSPPFPAMQSAYAARPLTEAEIAGLAAFLQRVDAERELHAARNYRVRLLGTGSVGLALLLGLYSLAWKGWRRQAVHQAIYERQTKSV